MRARIMGSGGRGARSALVAVLLVTLVGAGVALAAKQVHVPTHVGFKSAQVSGGGHAVFKGKVRSPRPCKPKKREVQIYDTATPNRQIAKAYSRPNTGRWKTAVATPPASGAQLYAIVEARVINKKGKTYICDPATSRTITFQTP